MEREIEGEGEREGEGRGERERGQREELHQQGEYCRVKLSKVFVLYGSDF